jgi:hypothetical protein
MRWLIGAAPQRPAAPKPALPALDSGLVLGGLPVSLPQIAPPAGFGRVGVTFEGQSLAARLAPARPLSPGPTLPDIAAIENASDSAPGGDNRSHAGFAELSASPQAKARGC